MMGTEAVAGFDSIMRASCSPGYSPIIIIEEYQVIGGKVEGKSLSALYAVDLIALPGFQD
ncbi:hypothetical protein [Muribaculum gordoncarteri]|uniref:hypothetical protein n=1 Tax=Muribaculum gordoncarteri TaxID=2530390 RepID=UPI003F6748AB